MFLGRSRPALARTVVAILAIVVIIVGAVVVYPSIGLGSPASSTSRPSTFSRSSSSSSSASSSSSVAPTTTTISSSASTTSSTTASSATFPFVLVYKPDTILITPGGNLTYASVNVLALPSPLPSGTEVVSMSALAPAGISVRFLVKSLNVSINSQMSLQGAADPPSTPFVLAAAPDLAPGDYRVTIAGTVGALSQSTSFTLKVVQNLVIIRNTVYSPSHVSVKTGSTVYWLNLGLASGGDNAQEYDVTFKTLNAQSPVLIGEPFYNSYSYTFNAPGVYDYACVQTTDCAYPYMTGEITVTN